MVRRIILVDADPLTRLLIRSYLAELPFSVVDFFSAAPALDALRTEHFDLLITELRLPGDHDGHWLLDEARGHLPDLPIIVVSEGVPPRPLLRTADAIIEKPFHPDELLGEILGLLPTKGRTSHR